MHVFTWSGHQCRDIGGGGSKMISSSNYSIYSTYSERHAWANRVDPDQTPQNAASDQVLHCLSLIQQFYTHSQVLKVMTNYWDVKLFIIQCIRHWLMRLHMIIKWRQNISWCLPIWLDGVNRKTACNGDFCFNFSSKQIFRQIMDGK